MGMTRGEAKKLEYNFPMPLRKGALLKEYEEVFISSGGNSTKEEAMKVLEEIKNQHPQSFGWYCDGGIHCGVFQEAGKWYAYRHHAKYA